MWNTIRPILGSVRFMENYGVLPTLSVGAASAGVLSHIFYFIHGEHHKEASFLFTFFLLVPPMSCLILTRFLQLSLSHALQLTATSITSYLGALWTSMIIYRSFFHRLHYFPGPPLARTSKLYHCLKLGKADNFRKLAEWHGEHGDFVRIGPAELSIISPNAAVIILGPDSPCHKSPWYDNGSKSLQTIRTIKEHEVRRKVWDRAFSAKALRSYESRVIRYTHELMEHVASNSGKPINVSRWFSFYSFDVMGDLAFGKSFGMLKNGKAHYFMAKLKEGMLPLRWISPIPWIIPVFARAPIIGAGYRELLRWSGEQVEKRKMMEVDTPDITSWLFQDDKTDREWLHGDGRLVVVAGSDTTAATLAFIFYYLALDPKLVEKLRAELKLLINTKESFEQSDLRNASLLNGVIYETLRMHPPVPSGTSRITPPEGITVDGVYVPGQTTVIVPHYAHGRSEKCYAQPNDFIPERWFSQPELIKSKNAFASFSLGPFGCIGKQLALMQIRAVISLLIARFDISLAPGDDGSDLLERTKDTFTVRLGDLNIVFLEKEEVQRE